MSDLPLDAIDLQILRELQKNARITNSALAESVGLSPTPCLRRVRRLEEAGVITGYTVKLDRPKAGLAMTVFVHITLGDRRPAATQEFLEAVRPLREVIACHALTGQHDFLLEIVVPDWRFFSELMLDQLGGLPGVKDLYSSVVLRTFKEPDALPLPENVQE